MTGRADVLVVGGSVAGLRTAEALRRLSYPGAVTILEAGDDLPYDRTAVSKKLLAPDGGAVSVGLRSRTDFDRLGVELRLRTRAESLDVPRRAVVLADGSAIEYSELVVATGAAARELPEAPRRVVHYLRTLADAHRLRDAMESAGRAVVVGAGFIGSEVASALAARGAEVTLVEPTGYPLGRALGDAVGARLAALHESRGIRLVPRRTVIAVRKTGSGSFPYSVTLDDGANLGTELVVVGVGARPNTGWLKGSGVELGDGIMCDEFCRASTPGVLAAGDVARWPNELFGESMRVEHWTNAMEQAAVVAWNIVHPDRPRSYAPVPYVWSDQHGFRLQIVGRPQADDEVCLLDESAGNATLVALYARRGQLTGAFTLDATHQALTLRRALAARASLDQAIDASRAAAGRSQIREPGAPADHRGT